MPANPHRRKRIMQACQALLALAVAVSCIGCNTDFGNAYTLDLSPLHRATSFQALPSNQHAPPAHHAAHGHSFAGMHPRHAA